MTARLVQKPVCCLERDGDAPEGRVAVVEGDGDLGRGVLKFMCCCRLRVRERVDSRDQLRDSRNLRQIDGDGAAAGVEQDRHEILPGVTGEEERQRSEQNDFGSDTMGACEAIDSFVLRRRDVDVEALLHPPPSRLGAASHPNYPIFCG